MAKLNTEKYWHRLFEAGILLKGVNGIFEIISGCLVLFVSKDYFSSLFFRLARTELLEDPSDNFINFLAYWFQGFSHSTKIFAATYILIHGCLNIFLAFQLYKERLWAYLVTIGVILLFMVYQIFRITHTNSIVLVIITIWDAIFIVITWHEYKYKKSLL